MLLIVKVASGHNSFRIGSKIEKH